MSINFNVQENREATNQFPLSKNEMVTLLRLNKHIGSVKDKVALLQVLNQEIKTIIQFDAPGLFIVNEEENYHFDLTVLHPQINDDNWNNALSMSVEDKIPHKGTAIEEVLNYKSAKLWNWKEDLFDKGFDHPYFPLMMEYKAFHAICCPLVIQGKTLGFFSVSSVEPIYTEAQLPLFSAISDIMGIAVSNILAIEDLNRENKFKESLLSISESIVAIKDRKQLFAAIFKSVQSIIPMDDTAIVVLNEDGTKWKDWTNTDNYHETNTVLALQQNGFDDWQEIDSVIETSINETGILTIDGVLEANHPFAPILYDSGLKEFMYTPLICQGKVLGSLYFDSLQYNTYSPKNFSIFKSVADMVAMAVSNILANEEILEREKEKTRLLSISSAICKINKRTELLNVIYQNIKSIFPFDSAGLFITDSEKDMMYEILDSEAFPDYLQTKLTQENNLGPWKLSHSNSESWWMKEELVISSMSDQEMFTKGFIGEAQFKAGIEYGLKHLIGMPMYANGKKIGAICFCSKIENFYNAVHVSMFKNISEQISIAVANILANEEILEREKEKTLLLSISEDIAGVRNKTELLQLIINKIKPLFNFYDCGILVIDNDNNFHDLAAIHPEIDGSEVNQHLSDKEIYAVHGLPYKGSGVECIIMEIEKTKAPVVFDYIAVNDSFTDTFLLKILAHMGYQKAVAGSLKTGGKIFGCFTINYKDASLINKVQIPLFQNVVDQLSVAVSNILANEEILKRENEKTKLLEITELIATVKNTTDLLRVIVEKIKPLFNFHDCGLFVISKDKQTHSDWAAVMPDVSPSEWNEMIAAVSTNIPHQNSLVEWMINEMELANNPILFDFKNLVEDFPEYPQFVDTEILEMGYRDCLATNLSARGKNIGFFCINALQKDFFKPSQFALFQSVAHSISIAVANIIANEEILEREKEKTTLLEITKLQADKKILELNLAKTLAQSLPWEDKLLEVGKLMQQYIPFQMLVINFENNEDKCPTFAFFRTGFNEYQKLLKDDLLRITKMDMETFSRIRSNLIKVYENPFILSGKSLKENNKNNVIKDNICAHFNFKSNFIYPLKLEKYGKIIFSFYDKDTNNFNDEHIQFFDSLENTLQLVFYRTLGLEEIEKLNNQLTAENLYLQEEIKTEHNFDAIIGNSRVLAEVFKNIAMVSSTDTTVLILGETGTGKELIARSLHNSSPRKSNSFIKVNCAALPAQLIESELFGHEKGSFTGAFERRVGKFELADNGSIFLDEIGELPLELQAKLLRVIQEKEFERIGGKLTIKCDVRIIAATNRILEDEVSKGRFRADLYYRLNVFPIHLPPLRERKDDITLLATHFAQKFTKKMNKHFKGINSSMLEALYQYQWPGNIRELENVIEQAVIVNQNNESLQLARQLLFVEQSTTTFSDDMDISISPTSFKKTFGRIKEEKEIYERKIIIEALQKTKGRIRGSKGAALLLNVLPTTLESKMKRYGIFKNEFDRI